MINKINLAITSVFLTSLPFHTSLARAEGSFSEGNFSLTSGVDYSTGKYGESQSTDITYVPFTAKYESDDTTLKLTIPWLKITGPGGVVGGDAVVI